MKKEVLDKEYFDAQRYRLVYQREILNRESLFWKEIVEEYFDDSLCSDLVSSDEFVQACGLPRTRRFDADAYDRSLASQNREL